MLIQHIRSLSSNCNKFLYVTTPIFYVNAAPHIGHLYSAVISDCVVRYEKLRQRHTNYLFSTGTDEHGTKIQQAAQAHNKSLKEYCTQISGKYQELFRKSNVDYTHFNRTSHQEQHFTAVKHFWNTLYDKNHIYKTNYSGWYCVSDEMFLTDSQLKEKEGEPGVKVSIESGHPVHWTEEINYKFQLSKFHDDVVYWIKQDNRIKPKKFETLLLHMLEEPLPDISVSRPVDRVHWGIKVPNDESQTIYVWLDALINYLTSAGYPNDSFRSSWPPSIQIIGKDILKFHGIYWPAFLIAAGLEPPQSLLVHSHWTVDDTKMSKSKHNVVDPIVVSEKYTFEGLRYFLLRRGVAHKDGNYSDVDVTSVLNDELANTLGNLLSRACAKIINTRQSVPQLHQSEFEDLLRNEDTKNLIGLLDQLTDVCTQHYDAHNFYLAIDEICKVLRAANGFVESYKPWELRKSPEAQQKLETVLRITFETLRICGILLQPIVPELSVKLLDKLNVDANCRYWKDARVDFGHSNMNADVGLGPGDAMLFKRIK